MMSSSLVKLAIFRRSLALFRPVLVTSPSRFFNTRRLDDYNDFEDNIPSFIRTCPPFIRDLITNVSCPSLTATHNLSRQLNMMDDKIGVKSRGYGFGRWLVGENEESLFLVRSMARLYETNVTESIPTRDLDSLLHLMHFNTPCPSWDVMKETKELNQFVESISGLHVFSFVRVFCTMQYVPAIYIVVGHEGPDPWDPCGGYVTKICLPGKFYKIEDVCVQINGEALKITIPKKNNQKPIYKFEGDFLLFRERKS